MIARICAIVLWAFAIVVALFDVQDWGADVVLALIAAGLIALALEPLVASRHRVP